MPGSRPQTEDDNSTAGFRWVAPPSSTNAAARDLHATGHSTLTTARTMSAGRVHLTAAAFFDCSDWTSFWDRYSSSYAHPHPAFVACSVRLDDSIQLHTREQARLLLMERFPVLVAPWVQFEWSMHKFLIWRGFPPDQTTYKLWRKAACEIFEELPDFLASSGHRLKAMDVEPLLGPWKWQFL